jgi:hypothetical protein
MAKSNLTTFIERLDAELSRYSDYRKELNRAPHTFVFHKRTLLNETLIQLSKGQGMTLNSADKEHIKSLVDIAAAELHSQLEGIAGHSLKRPGGKTTVVFDAHTDVPIPAHLDAVLPYPAFTRVKFAYRQVMNKYFTDMQDYFRNHKDLDTIKTKSGAEKSSIMHFFDAGHDKNAGVFERFLDTKTASIMSSMNTKGETASEAERKKVLDAMNKALGINLEIQKIDDLDTIIIKIESSSSNRSRGAKQGLRSKDLRKKIKKYLAEADLENVQGSDSLKTKKIKETRKAVLDPFKKVQGVTVSAKNTKSKKSSKQPAKKTVKPTIGNKTTKLVGTAAVATKTRNRRRRKAQSSGPSMLQIIAMMNKQLPATVRKNMTSPALENRTGRFASSVQLTDVSKTPKGFPSIGYTYQRNPYQVFEDGAGSSPWANGERDPRELIDRSIRELAAQFAIGRFYTRRV